MKKSVLILGILITGLIAGGVAAGLAGPYGTINYAGPVELRRTSTISGTEYYTIGRYATIQAALADINVSVPPPSATKRYVIFLPPGTYDLGSTRISLRQFVTLQGSGPDETVITCACGNATPDETAAVIQTSAISTVRDLTVKNTAGASKDYAIGVYNYNKPDVLLQNVHVVSQGGTLGVYGVTNDGGTPELSNVFIEALGFSSNVATGVYNLGGTEVRMLDVIVSAEEASNSNVGILNYQASPDSVFQSIEVNVAYGATAQAIVNNDSDVTMRDVRVLANWATGTNQGIYNYLSNSTLTRVEATVVSGGTTMQGIYLDTSSATLNDVIISVSDDAATVEGLVNVGGNTVMNGGMISVEQTSTNDVHGVAVINSSAFTMSNTQVDVTGGYDALAIYADSPASVALNGVQAYASGATHFNIGLYSNGTGTFTIAGSTLAGAAGGNFGHGIYQASTDAKTYFVTQSVTRGSTSAIDGWTNGEYKIGATLIDGGYAPHGATAACAESFDGSYGALDSTCLAAGTLLPPPGDKSGAVLPAPDAVEPPALPSPGE